MSEPLPITTPPRRRLDALSSGAIPSHIFNNIHPSSESCKNTPNPTRKLEPYHHALLDSGSQSAKSSPLPHRRLDKLEGVIRDKPSPMNMRRYLDDDGTSSNESSPVVARKHGNNISCGCMHQESPTLNRRQYVHSNEQQQQDNHHQHLHHHSLTHQDTIRRNTDCGCGSSNGRNKRGQDLSGTPIMRRRIESDCSCLSARKPTVSSNCEISKTDCLYSIQMLQKPPFSSPIKSVLGEPGCFSSPVHHRSEQFSSADGTFGSPAKSVMGEPGVFASPARSICISPCDDNLDVELALQPDQTIVSGWLKFRDNKRVSFI